MITAADIVRDLSMQFDSQMSFCISIVRTMQTCFLHIHCLL